MRTILRTVAIGALLALQAPTAGAETMYGLTQDNRMMVMADPRDPSRAKGPYLVEGLASGEMLVAIDGNPGNGAIYALGYRKAYGQAQLYIINTSGTTYTATPVGNTMNIPLGTDPGSIGFDFDASAPYSIVIGTSRGQRFVVNSSNGSLISSSQLAYNDADVHAGSGIDLAASAHINSFFGSDNTQMYGYDRNTNSIISFGNDGLTAGTVGNIGTSIAINRGIGMESQYDINNRTNTVYMVGRPVNANGSHLYQVNIAMGTTTDLGTVGAGNIDIKDITISTINDIPSRVEGNIAVALTANHRNLIFFDTKRPDVIRRVVWIYGATAGQSIMAVDFRPRDMALYGLGYNPATGLGQMYHIDMVTGQATALSVTPIKLALGSDATVITGFDFDPVADFVRVTASNGLNVRISPVNGQIITTDRPYMYAETDAYSGTSASLGAIAYTNSYYGTQNTQLIGIDYSTGALVSFNKPSTGVMNSVLNMQTIVGTGTYTNGNLDIYYDAGAKQNLGYITTNLYTDGAPYAQLYTLDPVSGATGYVGRIGAGIAVRDIAVQPKYTQLEVESVAKNHDFDLFLYPNPAINQTRVVLPTIAIRPVHAYITDMQGAVINHLVYAPGGDQIDIDVTSLRSGLYSIRVQEEGNTIRVARLLKQ